MTMANWEPKPLFSREFGLWLLLILNCTQGNPAVEIVGCLESYYLSNKKCHSCPEQCQTCISNDNCTTCVHGYFGRICRLTCEQSCSGQCHQDYGHCTLGCPDGQFPEPNSPACLFCREQCTLCSSRSKCVKCVDGFFGSTCSQRCHASCVDSLCQQDGECLKCKDGYYKDTYGNCVTCPAGCKRCVRTTNCSECQDGYFGPQSGICIEHCPIKLRMTYLTSYEDIRCVLKDCPVNKCIRKGYCINGTFPTSHVDEIQGRKNVCDALVYKECTQKCSSCEDAYGKTTMCDDGYTCIESCIIVPPATDAPPRKLCHSNYLLDDIIISIETPTYSCDTDLVPTNERQSLLIYIVPSLIGLLILLVILFVWLFRKRHQFKNCRQSEETTSNIAVELTELNISVQSNKEGISTISTCSSISTPCDTSLHLPEDEFIFSFDEVIRFKDSRSVPRQEDTRNVTDINAESMQDSYRAGSHPIGRRRHTEAGSASEISKRRLAFGQKEKWGSKEALETIHPECCIEISAPVGKSIDYRQQTRNNAPKTTSIDSGRYPSNTQPYVGTPTWKGFQRREMSSYYGSSQFRGYKSSMPHNRSRDWSRPTY